MSEEPLELHQVRILVSLWLEALPAGDVTDLLLSLEDHLQLNTVICFVLPWRRVLHRLEQV